MFAQKFKVNFCYGQSLAQTDFLLLVGLRVEGCLMGSRVCNLGLRKRGERRKTLMQRRKFSLIDENNW